MANREPPYDPYIPSGNGAAGDYPAHNGRTAALQAVSAALFYYDSTHT